MARFDVHRLKDETGLVVDCQADILNGLNTRFVAPLLPLDEAPRPAARLNPMFELNGKQFVLVIQFAAAVETRELGPIIGSLNNQDRAIMNALDMLLTGC